MFLLTSRLKTLILAACLAALLFLFSRRWSEQQKWGGGLNFIPSIDRILGSNPPPRANKDDQIEFWRILQDMLDSNKPGVGPLKRDGRAKVVGFDANAEPPFVEHIVMEKDEVESMKANHMDFVSSIKSKTPEMVYKPGSRGIVVTAGGKYLPLAVIALRIMKRIGNDLPMEVFLESSIEYESHVCEEILPSLNARCVILSEIIAPVPHSVELASYQLKAFALIFSSFEEVLFLDADAWPVRDPKQMFTSEPFLSTGLVTWPDFWTVTTSKYFYEIASIPRRRTNSRASSETGEILVSKRTHAKTLLLATYYNYYGPDHYYLLLSMGAPGEGDKETFLAAADVMDEPYYAVSEKIKAIGHKNDDGHFSGSAMVQYDPQDDWELTSQGLWRVKDETVAPRPRPMFVHANYPKLNPGTIFEKENTIKHDNGTLRRAWTEPFDIMETFEADVERRYWEEAEWVSCHLETKFRDWYVRTNICEKTKGYYATLFGQDRMDDFMDY